MVDTTLYNQLVQQQASIVNAQAERRHIQAKREILIERLKTWGIVALFLVAIALLLILLLWLLPSPIRSTGHSSYSAIEKECTKPYHPVSDDLFQPDATPSISPASQPQNSSDTKKGAVNSAMKDGIEYVKKDHRVYKLHWVNGNLIQETPLEESIEESRKVLKEDIPKMSIPKKGKEQKKS